MMMGWEAHAPSTAQFGWDDLYVDSVRDQSQSVNAARHGRLSTEADANDFSRKTLRRF